MNLIYTIFGLFLGFILGCLTTTWLDRPINKNNEENYYNHIIGI